MELVWDLEADNFRVFNWKAVEGDTKEIEIDSALFDVGKIDGLDRGAVPAPPP